MTSYDLQDKLVSKVDSVTGNIFHINTNLKVIVIAKGWSSRVYTGNGLGWRCISIFCQQEEGLVREWFTDIYSCEWLDWRSMSTVIQNTCNHTTDGIICLQGNAKFINDMIIKIGV